MYLACLVHPETGDEDSAYRDIFIGEAEDNGKGYFFTANMHEKHEFGAIDRHVSLAVDWHGNGDGGLPSLAIKWWANGLYFPDWRSQREIVFPWPSSLIV